MVFFSSSWLGDRHSSTRPLPWLGGVHDGDEGLFGGLGQFLPSLDNLSQVSLTHAPCKRQNPLKTGGIVMACHFLTLACLSTPEWIRTIDRRIRNPLLYPAELRARVSDSSVFLAFMGLIASAGLLP